MADPLFGVAIATAALGLAALLVGRPIGGWPRWHLRSRDFRLAGAVELAVSVAVVLLVATHNDGLAFLTFAVLAVAQAAAIQVVSRHRPAV